MTHLLGIDLGTSSVKVALIDESTFRATAVNNVEYPVYHPKNGYAEQNPAEWWNATVQAVRAVLEEVDNAQVVGIGLSGQMHGMVCLDQDLQPIQNAVIWADARSGEQVEQLQRVQPDFESTLPGLPATGFAASTVFWLKMHQPETLAQTHKWLLAKDYIRQRMTGIIATEPSDASSTWLFDVVKQAWAGDVLQFCGLTLAQMPEVVPSSEVVGRLTPSAAQELGLPDGVPVVAGSADLPAQALGQGILSPERALIVVGTGGQIFLPSAAPVVDEANRYYLFNHNQPEMWYIQAAMLAGGLALRWLRDTLGMTEPDAYAQLSALAATVPAGADGLLFLPYLAGERSPHMDAQASGTFFGLRLHHTSAHMARAVMEGVAFALRDCLELTPHQQVKQYVLSGGITQSAVWSQILSDVLGQSLYAAETEEPHGCIGAAMLAAVGKGLVQSVAEIEALRNHQRRVINPQPKTIYEDRFAQFRRMYPLLKDEMHRLNFTGLGHE